MAESRHGPWIRSQNRVGSLEQPRGAGEPVAERRPQLDAGGQVRPERLEDEITGGEHAPGP